MTQQAKNLFMAEDLGQFKFLIRDRDCKFPGPFDDCGVQKVRSTPRWPAFLVTPQPLPDGTGNSSEGSGPNASQARGGRRSPPRCGSWSLPWPSRIRNRAANVTTGVSTDGQRHRCLPGGWNSEGCRSIDRGGIICQIWPKPSEPQGFRGRPFGGLRGIGRALAPSPEGPHDPMRTPPLQDSLSAGRRRTARGAHCR